MNNRIADLDPATADAVAVLDAIDASDAEGAHYAADRIVLGLVDPAVRSAYERLAERVARQ